MPDTYCLQGPWWRRRESNPRPQLLAHASSVELKNCQNLLGVGQRFCNESGQRQVALSLLPW